MEPLPDEKLQALAMYTERKLDEAKTKGSSSTTYLADVFAALLELLDVRAKQKETT